MMNPEHEKAAAREAAERWLDRRIMNRVFGVCIALGEGTDRVEVYNYFNNPEDPDIEKLTAEENVLIEDILIGAQAGAPVDYEAYNEQSRLVYKRAMKDDKDPDIDLVNSLGKFSSYRTREAIADTRAAAILIELFTDLDPIAVLRNGAVKGLIMEAVQSGVDVPQPLLFMVDKASRVEAFSDPINTYDLEEAVRLGKLRAEIEEQGMHPKLGQRREETASQQISVEVEELKKQRAAAVTDFLQRFPDPRVVVDKILRVQDGKLPSFDKVNRKE